MHISQTLSLVNVAGCIACIVMMVTRLIKYEIPRAWQVYMFFVFVLTFLVAIGQIFTFIYFPRISAWLKMWATVYWIKTIWFCHVIKTVSMIKKNYN